MDEQTSAVIARHTILPELFAAGYHGEDLIQRDGAPTKGRSHASCPGSAPTVTRRSGAHPLG